MSRHLRSAPGGLVIVGSLRLVGTAVVLWILPGVIGAILLALIDTGAGGTAFRAWAFASALGLSPMFSWAGWLVALPLVALALHWGWFGWLPAALVGAFSGWLVGFVAGTELAGAFGMVAVLAMRGLLGFTVPAAFDPGPGR